MDKTNILCFPFAGGNKYSFQKFQEFVPETFEMVTYELPGRGVRQAEPLLRDMNTIVSDALIWAVKYLDMPYVIYGHSMGGLIGYELIKKLIRESMPLPLHLFVTGCGGPGSMRKTQNYRLPKADFIAVLKELGGVTSEIVKNEQIMDYYDPVLRADFQAIEEYGYTENPPLEIPVTCLIGSHDMVSYQEALTWRQETNAKVDIKKIPGDHFFIEDYYEEILNLLVMKTRRASRTMGHFL